MLVLSFVLFAYSKTSSEINSSMFSSAEIDNAVEQYLFSMPEKQRAAQIFLVNILGDSFYRPLEFDGGTPLVPGGCLFFNYNIAGDAEKIISFTDSIASYCAEHNVLRPYLAIDQEGGFVNRLRNITSPLPSNEQVSSVLSPSEAYTLYNLQGKQMEALGFDMNLGPVSEVLTSYNSDLLSVRSYGSAASAISYSIACINGYQNAGIFCVVKHFPGNCNSDPHTGTSVLNLTRAQADCDMIMPFIFMVQSNTSGVLMSHTVVPCVDKNEPAGLSSLWVDDILKDKLGFAGLVMSDDIFMGALSSLSLHEAAKKSVEAGVHVIMLSDKYFSSIADYLVEASHSDSVFAEKLLDAEKHVILFKLKSGIMKLERKDGELVIEEVSVQNQHGTDDARLRSFEKYKNDGIYFYNKHVSTGKNGF